MIFFYTNYRYSGLATLVNMFLRLIAIGIILGGLLACLTADGKIVYIILGIVALILGFICFFKCRILTDKIAEKDTAKNLRKNVNIALMYVRDNPESYEEICSINAKFAEKYTRDENGKIVKIKKLKNK